MSATVAAPRPTAGARPNGGVLGLLAVQAATDLRAAVRSTEFLVGTVGVPVLLYAMFGLPSAGNTLPGGTRYGTALLASFVGYGVVSLAIFTAGEWVAKERARGWTRTLAATPLPTWVALAGKVATCVGFALLVVASTAVVATTAGGVRLPADAWLRFTLVAVLGVVATSTLGFAIAYAVRPKAAAAVANLVFLPISFLSGFFVPLGELPPVLRDVAAVLPSHHLGQLLWRQVAPVGDVAALVGADPAPVAVSVAWVVGAAVLFGGLAAWAVRREAVTRRG